MRLGFYLKFALDGIKKNKKTYIPYILTSSLMFAMCHIIYSLKDSRAVSRVSIFMNTSFFFWIFVVFSGAVLFYTNSFLIKKRKKEFGLYNVLGMNKLNISKVLFLETAIVLLIVVLLGLLGGFLLYKFAETLFVKMCGGDIDYQLIISEGANIRTVVAFCAIFALIFFNSLRQVGFSSAISLVKSENFGEKPPKSNIFVGITGLLLLIGAYVLTMMPPGPWTGILFFGASILVIISTYIIMISSSVFICRVLKNNKKYYYKSNHFISISSMMYRMKRNGAGLASICILLTVIQFVISSCIFANWLASEMLKCEFPQQNTIVIATENNIDGLLGDNNLKIKNRISKFADENDFDLKNYLEYRSVVPNFSALHMYGDKIDMGGEKSFYSNSDHKLVSFEIIPIEDYNKNMGTNESLNYGEAIVYGMGIEYNKDKLSFTWGDDKEKTFKVVNKQLEPMKINRSWYSPKLVIFISDISEAKEIENMILSCGGDSKTTISPEFKFAFDINCDNNEIADRFEKFRDNTYKIFDDLNLRGISSRNYNNSVIVDFKDLNELVFLVVFFVIMFTLVVILIMYYKQFFEGCEDANRFDIMRKVGISKKGIKESVNSQLLVTFFAPLILSGIHTVFSTNMFCKLISTNANNNYTPFVFMVSISFILLSIFYCIMYKVTSKVYYRIVSSVDKN